MEYFAVCLLFFISSFSIYNVAFVATHSFFYTHLSKSTLYDFYSPLLAYFVLSVFIHFNESHFNGLTLTCIVFFILNRNCFFCLCFNETTILFLLLCGRERENFNFHILKHALIHFNRYVQ